MILWNENENVNEDENEAPLLYALVSNNNGG